MKAYEGNSIVFARIDYEDRGIEFQEYTTAISKRIELGGTPTTPIEAKTKLGMGLALSASGRRLQELALSRDSGSVDSEQELIRARTHRGRVIVPSELVSTSLGEAHARAIETTALVVAQPNLEQLEGLGSMALAG